ncbi:unnamed protein product [Urochloa humidicola]
MARIEERRSLSGTGGCESSGPSPACFRWQLEKKSSCCRCCSGSHGPWCLRLPLRRAEAKANRKTNRITRYFAGHRAREAISLCLSFEVHESCFTVFAV